MNSMIIKAQNAWQVHLVMAVVLVGISVWLALQAMPVAPAMTNDSPVFINAAQHLAEQGLYQIDLVRVRDQGQVRTVCGFFPGFSALLALFFRLGIPEAIALKVLVTLLLTSLSLLVYFFSAFVTGNKWWGAIAAVWVLSFQPILDQMTYLLTETLYIPLSVAVIFLAAIYLRRGGWKIFAILCALMAITAFVRPVFIFLLAVVGGLVGLKSLFARKIKRAFLEGGLLVSSIIPLGIYLLANPYCATGGKGLFIERTTTAWLVQVLVDQLKPNLMLGFGIKRLFSSAGAVVILVIGLALVGLIGWLVWKQRKNIQGAVVQILGWEYLLVAAYTLMYYSSIFVSGNSWAKFDFPRLFVPGYPFIFICVILLMAAFFRHVSSNLLRGLGLAGLFLLLAANAQSSILFYQNQVPLGRGIESAQVGDSPALKYVRETLQPKDLLFTTNEPTVWYYLRKPAIRLEGLDQISCQQLAQPSAGGRSLFVLYPEIYIEGDPTSAENVAWFKNWVKPCGNLEDARVLDHVAIYVLEVNSQNDQ
jgi:hypothetical protein